MLSIHIDPTTMSGPVGPRLTIPTHITPTGGEATHPSIAFIEEKWNGYRYWMIVTPFPSGNEQHEDPNLLVSNDGTTWIPAPGVEQPLDDQPGGLIYNSDVNLAFAEGKLFIFWRTVATVGSLTTESFYYTSSEDGVNWAPKYMIFSNVTNGTKYLSPSFHWDGDKWYMWVVNMQTNPNTVELRTLEITGWSDPILCNGITMQSGKDVWHLEVKEVGGRYVMLVADIPLNSDVATNADLVLATSDDGINWTSAARPLIPRYQANEHDRLYKSTFVPAIRNGVLGLDLWYGGIWSTTNAWRLYRTWVAPSVPLASPFKEAQQGFTSYSGGLPGNSGVNGVTVNVYFAKPFLTVPHVMITIDNTVLHATVIQRTTTGFKVRLENYTATNAGGVGIQWVATTLY